MFEVLNRVTPYNAMHCKYGVFGVTSPKIVTDAGNWSRASLGSGSTKPSNDESVLFLDAQALDGGVTGLRYTGNFLAILDRYGLDTRGVLARLLALPGWPRTDITFAARAETVWGQQVRATGDIAELTHWGRGVALDTSAESYPRWTSQPVSLPFGSRVEYKLIKDSAGRITWEAGGNRTLVIDPTDRRVVGGYPITTITTDLTWR